MFKKASSICESGAKYCNTYKPYNTFFIVDNREEVINFLTTSNFRRICSGAKSIRAYDFSNLYTAIPHQKLKMNIRKFINEVFDASGKLYVDVNYNKAYLSNKMTDLSFSAQTRCNTISILIDNLIH